MAASSYTRALPLLGSVAPRTEHATTAPNCHRCSREFGILTRRKICSHCGYQYCSSCCDHQAVSPRSDSSYSPGYDTVMVCTYCIEMLSITASGKSQLRGMPIVRLRAYLDAYGIKPKSMLEKDDLIEAIIDARSLSGGLSSDHERFYRRQTIANRPPTDARNRNIFSSYSGRTNAPAPPPRPRSTDPRVQTPRQAPASAPSRPSAPPPRASDPAYQPPQYPRPMSPRTERPPPVNTTWSPPPGPQSQHRQTPWPNSASASPPPQPRWQTRPQSPPPQMPQQESFLRPPSAGRSRSRSVPSSEAPYPPHQHANSPPPPPPPSSRPRAPVAVPLLSSLLDKSREDVSAFNIASLKGILQANHVNARLILEKSELVEKVMILIEVEKRERAREQAIHEAEERAAMEQQRQRMEQMKYDAERRARASASGSTSPTRVRSPPPTRPTSPRPTPAPPSAYVERDGLCVVCQDEEANVAVVDCGHLCLCMSCSDVIMKSTKECPLCRTRIVTEQRLLRIFRA